MITATQKIQEEITYLDKIEIDCTQNGWLVSAFVQEGDYDWLCKRQVFQDDQKEEMNAWIQELLLLPKKDT